MTTTRARAVIGANLGDEGKGAVTDYLCSQGAGVVVRFNGSAQAGHTVVTPDGLRHVHHHFGSGTLLGVPTFLSQFFVCNPIIALMELEQLTKLGVTPQLFAHPNCLVTTFGDMMINQAKEDKRSKRHGSVGLGLHETMQRSQVAELKIAMSDLWNRIDITDRLAEICGKWATYRTGAPIEHADERITKFKEMCETFADFVQPAGIQQCEDPVFEGAQGLLLDQDNKESWPHVTHSKTGMHNVRILCEQAGIRHIEMYYVSRTYLTRHGAGPLPREDAKMKFYDDTNGDHPYQGKLRFAPLDPGDLFGRIRDDARSRDFKLVLTHCDQLFPKIHANLYFDGPTREDVMTSFPSMKAAE